MAEHVLSLGFQHGDVPLWLQSFGFAPVCPAVMPTPELAAVPGAD